MEAKESLEQAAGWRTHRGSSARFTGSSTSSRSLGEVAAAERYGLSLLRGSAETHDATADDGRLVQIKATQSSRIGLRSEPSFLLVLRITKKGRCRRSTAVKDGEPGGDGRPNAEEWPEAGFHIAHRGSDEGSADLREDPRVVAYPK